MRAAETMEALAALGEKKTGSLASVRAREIIARGMAEAVGEGCEITEEAFPARICISDHASVEHAGGVVPGLLLDYTGEGQSSVRGRLVYMGSGSPMAFQLRRVQGAIVACKANLLHHRVVQVERAWKAGALGMILVSRHGDLPVRGVGWPGIGDACPLPVVSVTGDQWQCLRAAAGQEVGVSWQRSLASVTGTNLVCDLAGESAGDRLVLGAHYDTWEGGAQDNCSGVGLLVSLAARLKEAGLHRGVRCLFFDGEELGMLGSRWHVSQADTETYQAYVNLEMPVPTRGARLRTFFFSGRLLLRALPFPSLLRHGYLPIPLEWFYWAGNKAFPSDVDPFYRAGVPSATTFCAGTHTHTTADTCDRVRTACFSGIERALLRMVATLQEKRCR